MTALIRIGALASRTGVSTHLLRVWEERYRLLAPERTRGGYRLYGAEDERRVRAMLRLRAQGVSAAEAATTVLGSATRVAGGLDGQVLELCAALTSYDESSSGAIMDQALAGHDVLEVVDRLFFPCLRYLGRAWAEGRITVGQEHFASISIRRRMLDRLARVAGEDPSAPRAVLACTPHEHHDIGLLALALSLERQGWRATYLGADTPVAATLDTGAHIDAGLVVLCGTERHMFAAQVEQSSSDLAGRPEGRALALLGRAATPALAAQHLAYYVDAGPVTAGQALVALVP